MLNKRERRENDKEFTPDKIMESKLIEPSLGLGEKEEKTIIGKHISIEGNIHGDENLVIKGFMKGNVELEKHTFEVGSKGRFEGEIHAKNVRISGQMIGNIKTPGKVEITREANFVGEIKAKTISVDEGAYLKGAIELDREPHKNTAMAKDSKTFAVPLPIKEANNQVDKITNK